MSDHRLFQAMPLKSDADDATEGATWSEKFEQAARPAATRRTVGVYERPAARTGLSLPVIVIMILATLISLVLSVRFLF